MDERDSEEGKIVFFFLLSKVKSHFPDKEIASQDHVYLLASKKIRNKPNLRNLLKISAQEIKQKLRNNTY